MSGFSEMWVEHGTFIKGILIMTELFGLLVLDLIFEQVAVLYKLRNGIFDRLYSLSQQCAESLGVDIPRIGFDRKHLEH